MGGELGIEPQPHATFHMYVRRAIYMRQTRWNYRGEAASGPHDETHILTTVVNGDTTLSCNKSKLLVLSAFTKSKMYARYITLYAGTSHRASDFNDHEIA